MNFVDSIKVIKFISSYDKARQEILLSLPLDFESSKSYPLVISPHPFGWSNFENFAYGAADLLQPFDGWSGISNKYKVIVALPLGHGRIFNKISLGWEGQIKDLVSIPEILENTSIKIEENKIYICGLSMGGMETLTTLGMYPGIFKAGFSFNGIADLKSWYSDIINGKTDKKLLDIQADKPIIEEVGGKPIECLEEYGKRSAVSYVGNLTKSNLMIYWSSKDSIVVNQELNQSKKLFDLIKAKNPNSQVYEHDHSYDHGFDNFDAEECIKCHEYSDFELAIKWFLSNY